MAEYHEISGYNVMATLGHGARSTIYAVRDSRNRVYALKRVVKSSPADQRYIDQALLEHKVASQFDHPLLRKSYKVIRERALIRTTEVLVLMEMIDGLTMEMHKPDSMLDMCILMRQAALGLAVMHEGGYVHADIKPNNIIVTDTHKVKLIDFGQSCPIGTIKERIQGTPDYIAPEQVLRRVITPQTDVFNLGASMYWLLVGKHVPTKIPKQQAGELRTHEPCRSPAETNPDIVPALSALVMDCIEEEPSQRPATMHEVADRLEIAASQLTRQAAQRKAEQKKPSACPQAESRADAADGEEDDSDATVDVEPGFTSGRKAV